MRPNWLFDYDMNTMNICLVILHERAVHVLESLEILVMMISC